MNWDMTPIKGSSGNAYSARVDKERLFIKKNGNPFLASIVMEGITPRVLWTSRTIEGDTLSAQPWISGHTLSPDDMTDTQINVILSHLHRSHKLVESYKKMGSQLVTPAVLLEQAENSVDLLKTNSYLTKVIAELKASIPELKEDEIRVVHGDVNHKNWMLEDKTQKLYLVDWDTVFLSDPCVDIAHILSHYIKPSDWKAWLQYSGYVPTDKLMEKIAWYGKLSFLRQIAVDAGHGDLKNVNEEILALRAFNDLF
ncbi:phosphotransferase family protein [Lactococcus termiticola]|uniref:Aminoglycoside phosphotransferase n=1 Tax=Lactococcus termiticola TaxID=2169526 RepID=A0A2R5HF23_9LACT|nr:phosphotransferase family protein [Lactococcus termiticola]GBG96659.1 aminoglycoside phosphotransferase [Lactococcus termiticola]